MTLPWTPVIYVDIFGSILTLGLAVWCAVMARDWTQKKPDDIFRHYIFLLTLAIVFFAISRSVGHLLKQILLLNDMKGIWKQLSPYSGAVNSVAFVIIFAFGIYFHRFQRVNSRMEEYKNNLEEMIEERTAELEKTNKSLAEEITEREYVERALKESQGYLQAILSNATLPMWLKDIEDKYVHSNKEFEALVGLGYDDIFGLNDFELFPEKIATIFQAQDAEVKRKCAPVQFEETISLAGKKHTFIISRFPLWDNGVIYAVGGVCTDITARKHAEEKLAAEQEQLAVTLRSIGDGVITTNTAGDILLINKIAENLTGWSQTEAIGQTFSKVFQVASDNLQQYKNPVKTVLETGQRFTPEEPTTLTSKQGREFIIANSGAPILTKEGKAIGVVFVFRDITHRLKLEEESLKVKKLESIGVLAGGIAHDFNNILAAIMGNINLASIDNSLKDETRQLLAEAEKASLRAKNLTLQLLTFARGGAPVRKSSSLREVIIDSAQFVLHGENIACEYDIPDNLWLVDIDKGQISQVVQNIIINAKHAMPDGGVITVCCANNEPGSPPQLSQEQKSVRISISDNGTGIPDSVIDKIFDPYFSTKGDGNGLGLSICHSIISKHGGSLSVDSKPGSGTTFTFTLPASIRPAAPQSEKPTTVTPKQQAKILIMDDEPMICQMAKAMLCKFGHEVVLAQHGEEAIKLFGEAIKSPAPIDLTIMDLTIPGAMGGKDAVKELLKIDPNAKVIVSSGYSNDPIVAKYREYGFCGSLVKPYDVDDLQASIAEALK